jgi:hypothetical protein
MPEKNITARTRKAAPAQKSRLFHARMLVTRLEEWCVEAATPEEARALFAAGAGHRCTPGESLHVEFDRLIDE